MRLFRFKSMRGRLAFWFLILTLVPLMIVLTITYFQRVDFIKTETMDKLTAIRDLKVNQLNAWLTERTSDITIISGDTKLKELEQLIGKKSYNKKDREIISDSRQVLNRFFVTYPDYYEFFIINPVNGKKLVSTQQYEEGEDRSGNDFFLIPMASGKIYLKDIYYSQYLSKLTMTYSAPIFGKGGSKNKIIGILVAHINVNNSLYKLLLERIGLGKTGETLIVNKDIVALNQLRWYENAPLNLKIAAKPAVNAAHGETAVALTNDYRGEVVLAAYTYIPQTGWGFVCKQDMQELDAPVRDLMLSFLLIFCITSIVILLLTFAISKSISRPILELNVHAQKFRGGEFSARNTVLSVDELGSLAIELNSMSKVIESKLKIQGNISKISDKLIKQTSLHDLSNELLKELMEISGASMSTFYVLNEVTSEYQHFASIGASIEMLRPFRAEHPQGEFGNVISQKTIFYLNNIPENSGFTYNTTIGDFIPKEIITIPVLVEDAVVAVISLASIKNFSPESYETIKLSWHLINTTYSNLQAGERTKVFSEMLSRNFQQLEAQSEELQVQSEELQVQTQELQQKSEELQQQNIELAAQKNQVESANQLKSEFLSNMSHELRTPLNSIMALSQVLIMQTKNILGAEQFSYLEIVRRNGKNLLALINDILDLSKIEAGKMEIIPKKFSVGQLLEMTKENLMSLAASKDIQIDVTIPTGLPKIESDERKLHQVLTNIVGNAVKFTEQGSIEISAVNDSSDLYITIKDSGIGISKETLPHIFEEFRQGDGTTSRRYEGTGLGLAIAYKIIKILGGDIKAESVLGEGSVFTIRIPIVWHEDIQSANSIIAFNTNTSPTDNPTILVVDDDPVTVQKISTYLEEEGFNTLIARSGREALQLAEKHQPFAITLDVIMPEMDGWEVLQKLKSNHKTKHIPVIAISVSNERDTGFALGAVGYIQKPVDRKILISEIIRIVKSPKSIMIVDDNEFERNEMARIIESEHMKTVLAKDGKECLEMLNTHIPDLLVLDLMMPGINGFEVIKRVRENERTKNLPVIVVTAKELAPEDRANLKSKISSMITKSEATQQELFLEIKRVVNEIKVNQKRQIPLGESHKVRILMVEDNPDAIVQVKTVLEKEHYIVDIAGGGQAALDYVSQTIPDGIILDLMMPGIDGFKVLEKIRSTERTKLIPVLILTAKDLTKSDLAKLSANNIQQLIHKGDVDIEGLLFKVKLMLGTIPKAINMAETVKPEILELLPDWPDQKIDKRSDNGLQNILVIEDNLDNMITMKAILNDRFNFIEAYDGESGIALAQSQIPDIILLDISLPGLSGEEVIALIKSNEKTMRIPVIAVTAQAMMGDKERFLKLGCDGYVSKPIDHDELMIEIGRLVRG